MRKTSNPSEAGGPAPPPGLTESIAESGSLPSFAYGSVVGQRMPGFTYRREGQCFVLTPARHTVSQVLRKVIMLSLLVGAAGGIAYFGATLIQPQVDTSALITFAVLGAGLFLFGFVLAAGVVWSTVADLCFGTHPSVLDRGRGEFRVGPRVVCGLGDIARLHLRRGHDPDSPENLANARYYASFVLRDGRRVPLGLSARYFFHNLQETALGDGVAGARLEAVMQAAAAFIRVEYVLTAGPDARLRDSGDC